MRNGFLPLLGSILLFHAVVFAASNATVTLSNLIQPCDGSPKSVTVTTSPSGLATSVTYNGSTNLPSAIGNYTVVATVTEPNYQGGATNTFTIRGVSATALMNQSVCAGRDVTFITTVSGSSAFTCQWFKNGATINGATNTSLTLSNAQPSDTAEYSIRVVGLCDSVTNTGTLMVGGSIQGSVSFTNNTPLTINTYGKALTYPSVLDVSCLPNGFSNITVTLLGLTHGYPDDLDILLVTPSGRAVILMSDCGGGSAVSGVNLTFDDASLGPFPDRTVLTTSTNRTTNYDTDDVWPLPAPGSGYTNTLSSIRGFSPNGAWSLYIFDDTDLDGGSLQGWSITFHVEPGPVLSQPVLTNNTLQFFVKTTANRTNVIETSTNLFSWTPVYTNVPPTNGFFSTNIFSPANARRFYRAVLLPP